MPPRIVLVRWGVAALFAFAIYLIWGPSVGLYQLSGSGPVVWRMNTTTGDVSWCRNGNLDAAPVCSPYSGRH